MSDQSKSRVQGILDTLPDAPGVYLMKGEDEGVIYVGKAKSLKNRVRSYFNNSPKDAKTQALVGEIHDIELRRCDSEVEAFVLENELIKRFMPQFNVELKDGKTFPHLAITQEDFPRVYVTRELQKKGVTYFGPFVDVGSLHESLNVLQQVFRFRTTKREVNEGKRHRRPCLNHSIGRCTAPCIHEVSKEDYQAQVKAFIMLLRGKKRQLIKQLEQRMLMESTERKYEQAAQTRDQIQALKSLNKEKSKVRRRNKMTENLDEGMIELQNVFYLEHLPRHIEGIDISNTSGRESVGSLVVFHDAHPNTDCYRRFKIKSVQGPNDFDSIYEVVLRRYGRMKREGDAFPDIILIDGGLGQLGKAQQALNEIGDVSSFLVSIAKKEEILHVSGREEPILLPFRSLGLRLLQGVRDESHRFAKSYHTLLRSKRSLGE